MVIVTKGMIESFDWPEEPAGGIAFRENVLFQVSRTSPLANAAQEGPSEGAGSVKTRTSVVAEDARLACQAAMPPHHVAFDECCHGMWES